MAQSLGADYIPPAGEAGVSGKVKAIEGPGAGFPGERLVFKVTPEPADRGEIRWSGGGEPATGTGRRFRSAFVASGTHTVTATRGSDSHSFAVEIAPLEQWMLDARTFYGHSLDFSKVRVKASRIVFGPAGTGWTCNTVIRFKRARRPEDLPVEPTLIHELGHVWEHQTGQAQLLRGMIEQLGRLFGRDPYDYGGPDGVRKATKLTQFKKEGQAQIIMEHWKSLKGYSDDSMGVSLFTPGYRDDLRRLVQGAGIGSMSREGRSLTRSIDSAVAHVVNGVLGPFE
jgi:hypothetical protein